MVHIEIIKKELNNNYTVIYDNEIKKEIQKEIQTLKKTKIVDLWKADIN